MGFLSIRMVLQSFCRPRRPGKKHAVTVNTVSFFYKFLLVRSISVKNRSFGTLYSHRQRWRHFKTLWRDGTYKEDDTYHR